MTEAQLISTLPPEWPEDLRVSNRQALLESGCTLVVLDDDPTGTQTVYDVPVLTTWDVATLSDALREELPLIFLLTNSRALTVEQTTGLHRTIAAQLTEASRIAGRPVEIISRSDSTLRGHFPLETDVLAEGMERLDFTLVAPFFAEGGRLTCEGQHYVREGSELIPAHETPFAKDPVFSFRSSRLPEWVEEKSGGRVRAGEVCHLSIGVIREGGPDAVRQLLDRVPAGSYVTMDALVDRDVEVLARALAELRKQGKRFMARTAASYVRAVAGLPIRKPLERPELVQRGKGGLIVVGSHVPKTTAQLQWLLDANPPLTRIELPVDALLEDFEGVIGKVAWQVSEALERDEDLVLFTSRELVSLPPGEANLSISAEVSRALVEALSAITLTPRFIIAKGGITSSDIATEALKVKRADVAGSILPGVPVWRLGADARFPGMHYVIFPGNVGDETALAAAYEKVKRS